MIMADQIFCPSNHLILGQTVCPVCGWERPAHQATGTLLWPPLDIGCGIGGPTEELFVRPGIQGNVIVFPLRSGELVGINQSDGKVLWRTEPEPSYNIIELQPFFSKFLAVYADNHQALEDAGDGFLVTVDPQTGKIEKIWQGYGYSMSEVSFTDSLMILRTARPKLVALKKSEKPSVVWEKPLKSFRHFSPIILRDEVIVWDGEISKDQSILKAFALSDGSLKWQRPIAEISSKPVILDNLFIFRSGKKSIIAFDLSKGEVAWQEQFPRIYSQISLFDGKLIFVACGDNDINSSTHYSLFCQNPGCGEMIWQKGLGIRGQEIVEVEKGKIIVGMGDNKIVLCSTIDGEILWQHSLGVEKLDRLQTHLTFSEGVLWMGTYRGVISALRFMEKRTTQTTPQELLDAGEIEAAANAFAINGDLEKSAEIFMDRLHQPQRAKILYEYINNLSGQARVMEELGDELNAARLYEMDGKFLPAANLYEKAGDFRSALTLFQKLHKSKEINRLRPMVPAQLSDVEELENEGKFEDAGDLAFQFLDFRKALDLYDHIENEPKEKIFQTLLKICEKEPEQWCLSRLAEVARTLGKFEIQAKAYENLCTYDLSAIAYMHAAQQLETRSPEAREKIADFYDIAQKYFDQEGMDQKRQQCWDKVVLYRQLPRIEVSGGTDKPFREGEFNTLFLVVKNSGFGRADDVTVSIQGDRFEVDRYSLPDAIRHLAAAEEKKVRLPIRPLKDQVGDEVPFTLVWSWKDRIGHLTEKKTFLTVSVKAQSESRTGGTPVIINATNYYEGDDQHKEVKEGGQYIEKNDQIGDRVEVNDGKIKVVDSEFGEVANQSASLTCPNCGLPILKDAKFCDTCGYSFQTSK